MRSFLPNIFRYYILFIQNEKYIWCILVAGVSVCVYGGGYTYLDSSLGLGMNLAHSRLQNVVSTQLRTGAWKENKTNII